MDSQSRTILIAVALFIATTIPACNRTQGLRKYYT